MKKVALTAAVGLATLLLFSCAPTAKVTTSGGPSIAEAQAEK